MFGLGTSGQAVAANVNILLCLSSKVRRGWGIGVGMLQEIGLVWLMKSKQRSNEIAVDRFLVYNSLLGEYLCLMYVGIDAWRSQKIFSLSSSTDNMGSLHENAIVVYFLSSHCQIEHSTGCGHLHRLLFRELSRQCL